MCRAYVASRWSARRQLAGLPWGMRRNPRVALLACVAVASTVTGGCTPARSPEAATTTSVGVPSSPVASLPPPVAAPTPPPPPSSAVGGEADRAAPVPSTTNISLSIPALRVDALRVVSYRGTADDRPGTRIQNRGLAATPRGPRGGVGPGEVGNMVVTAHRTTAGKPFGRLPSLRVGSHVLVESGGLVYDYRITSTLT